ncbi:hypothetical protein BH18ACI5_BH18ACI5_21700 [soil metagenome]
MRNRAVAALIAAFVAVVPAPADAWGFEAHKYIMARAINLLPAQLRPYFEANRSFLIERAIDPDLWRTAGWEEESARHYVDMDAYGAYPFNDLPHDHDAAVQKFGKEFVEKNGTLPWRAEEIYTKLVEAFQQKAPYSRDNIRLFSAIITHYLSDAQVPFHASLNHDGQLTQQWGIHSRFESELFERYRAQLRVVPKPVLQVASTRELIFESLTSGFPYVQQVLDADKQAASGREMYDDGYFRTMFASVRPILETRLSESITRAASVITAAWIEAGRPGVPVKAPPRLPRKIRRQ